MSYRSLKRVLGETSLERKCRLLFGTCLLLLIGGAFYWVDSIAEKLVIETTRSKGRDLVDLLLLQKHFLHWETSAGVKKDLVIRMIRDLEKDKNYRYEVVALPDEAELTYLPVDPPLDDEETTILLELKRDFRQRMAETRLTAQKALTSLDPTEPERTPGGNSPAAEKRDTPVAPLENSDFALRRAPVFRDRKLPDKDQYHYFEPVRWEKSCKVCHSSPEAAGAISASEGHSLGTGEEPFHVVKVVLPYKQTQSAINKARAVLIAVAILTVFVAMVALYVIVRYVIVRPLTHLRDVSDDVSRGKTELRADIQTGDEFEQLADSFNRMLRHLTETQEALRQVNTDLDAKVDQLAQLNMRLYEMNRLKGDFLANMTHELRTPLNSIIGFSEVLQGVDSLNDKQKRYIQNIQKAGRNLLDLINDILDLAKLEAGKMELRPSDFPIEAVVAAQSDMVRALTDEKNIDLKVEIEPGVPPVYQDQIKVQQILTNLLSNAIKFTPEGGRITVAAGRDAEERLVLTVADTGVGISPEHREIIFEKFRQGPATQGEDSLTREYSGTGLGLSIVKELCKLLGGEISFESELGKGSTFKVVLPWTCSGFARPESKFAARLDTMTMPPRADFEQPRVAVGVHT